MVYIEKGFQRSQVKPVEINLFNRVNITPTGMVVEYSNKRVEEAHQVFLDKRAKAILDLHLRSITVKKPSK